MAAVSAAPAAGAGRIWGWDLLRGLCALAVMAYHLLLWLDLASLHTLGSYGVYLFFVLSGASLAHTYARRLGSAPAVASFFVLRWLRLTPLFVVAALLSVALFSVRAGQLVDQLPLRLALNLTYAFGVVDPVIWALPIGGWSLGIEWVFYAAFPLLLPLLRHGTLRWGVLAAAVALQVFWIQRTVGAAGGYDAHATAYHHAPAFGAYFVAGCLIGLHTRARGMTGHPATAGAAAAGLLALLLVLNPATAGPHLLGVPGVLLPLVCALTVWISGRAAVPARWHGLARWMGDITYGSYLLHPLLFFGLTWLVLPDLPASTGGRVALALAVGAAACLAAVASERWLESPVRRWAYGRTRRWLGAG